MNAGVIFTTYNSPAWLTKVLWGYEQQTDRNVQIIIADDGSGAATADVIDRFQCARAMQKSTASRSAFFIALSGKRANASRAIEP